MVQGERIVGAMDPNPVLKDTQNWSSRSHRELYESVHQGNEPGRVGELAQDWSRMGAEIGESSQRMADRLRRTEEGWQGEAADSARRAIHELADWVGGAGATAGRLGDRIGEQGRVMEVAKTSMPEPKEVEFHAGYLTAFQKPGRDDMASLMGGIFLATQDLAIQTKQVEKDHDEAVAVMEKMEGDSRALDGRTPRFEPPPDPIRDGTGGGIKSQAPPAEVTANGKPAGSPTNTEPASAPLGESGSPGGGHPDQRSGALVPPAGGSQPGGTDPAKPGTPALSTSASNTPGSAPQLQHTPQISGDKGSPNQGPGARVPSLDGSGGGGNNRGKSPVDRKNGPESTTSQCSGPKSTTSPNGVDQPTIKHRPVPKLGSPDTPGGGPVAPGGPRPGGQGPGGGCGGSNVGAGGRSSVGTGPTGGAAGGPSGAGSSGSSGAGAGAGGMGAPGAGRGRGGEDEERRAKYVESTPIVEVPGADLPPPVIGGDKPKKKDD